ncbi:MAG: hypothetical protein WC449_04845 [Candidatus Paceibacterota bacterium]
MKVTFELTTEEFKELFGVSVVNNVVCELKETETGLQPNWNDAPEWANYWAIDKNGHGHFYEQEPFVEDYQWVVDFGDYQFDHNYGYIEYWKDTLRRRPQ